MPPIAHGSDTKIPPSALYAFWYCQRVNRRANSPVFEFQSRYIEHHFEARAKLPPILMSLRVGFLFCRLQLNDRLNGILRHDFPNGNERDNAAEKTGAGTTFGENGKQQQSSLQEDRTPIFTIVKFRRGAGSPFQRVRMSGGHL